MAILRKLQQQKSLNRGKDKRTLEQQRYGYGRTRNKALVIDPGTKHFGTRQRETQTIYTEGNGEQVETIRAGKTIRPVTHEEGQVT